MARQYFGTDGIRGTVGQSPITPDFILRLAHAVGRVLKSQEAHPTVLIGKDTRISGYMLESALESGFNSAGVACTARIIGGGDQRQPQPVCRQRHQVFQCPRAEVV